MQTTNKTPIDFTKVEMLRKHMLLTTNDIAELFGVSRMTYYGWVRGKKIRVDNESRVRERLKQLLKVLEGGWPQPEIIAIDQKQRKLRLVETLEQVM